MRVELPHPMQVAGKHPKCRSGAALRLLWITSPLHEHGLI